MLYFNALLTDYSILNVYFHSIQNFDPYYEIIFKLSLRLKPSEF